MKKHGVEKPDGSILQIVLALLIHQNSNAGTELIVFEDQRHSKIGKNFTLTLVGEIKPVVVAEAELEI